jgi:predicted DNA-binding protein (MmcQ/YjbR family)
LKCDPEWAVSLREQYDNIQPGWHMNKKHWNTVQPDEAIPFELLRQMIDESYDLVFKSLKKADRDKILSED